MQTLTNSTTSTSMLNRVLAAHPDYEDTRDQGTTRAAVLRTLTTDDGPILTLSYACDFKAEEEMGVGKLRSALTETADASAFPYLFANTPRSYPQRDLLTVTDDVIAISTRPTPYGLDRTLDWSRAIIRQNRYMRGLTPFWELKRLTVPELRKKAAADGVTVPARARKDDLVEAIGNAETPMHPYLHPACFGAGETLVIPRGDGAFRIVTDAIIDAMYAGTLTSGLGGAPFGSGVTLFDSRDLGERTRDAVLIAHQEHEAHMAALEPVTADLKAKGHRWFFLGKPTTGGDGQVRYWLNGDNGVGFGWFTLEQLASEAFLNRGGATR